MSVALCRLCHARVSCPTYELLPFLVLLCGCDPQVCIRATLINFTVTLKGLEDQLLVDVVRYERPDLEQRKDKLIVSISQDKRQLKEVRVLRSVCVMLNCPTARAVRESRDCRVWFGLVERSNGPCMCCAKCAAVALV